MSDSVETVHLRDTYLGAMRRLATTVAVVVTDGPHGHIGITVSAIASVSADPPMILACINRRSPAVRAIQMNGVLTVNLLSAEQSFIAEVFAGVAPGHAPFDFACADWASHGVEGAQHLHNAAASMHGVVDIVHEHGTHAVIVARIVFAQSSEAEPLVYVRRKYGRVIPRCSTGSYTSAS